MIEGRRYIIADNLNLREINVLLRFALAISIRKNVLLSFMSKVQDLPTSFQPFESRMK